MSIDQKIFTVAKDAALAAGEVLLRHHRRQDFGVSKKGRINLVTDADLESEELIVERIRENFPDHRILAEERGSLSGDSPVRWVVDPLDGTTNFAHGYPCFCVSIGVELDGKDAIGVVFNPVSRELFTARKGQGAQLNGEPIHVSAVDNLVDSLLVTGFSYDRDEIEHNLRHFNRLMLHARAVRRDGSAAMDLCSVACGRFDGFWELSLHPWDVAAGKLIVEEAGGRVTAFDGSKCGICDEQILATNGKVHSLVSEQLLKDRS